MPSLLNRLVVSALHLVPRFIVRRFAGRYIAGDTLEEALTLVRTLNQNGIMATLDILGEGVENPADAQEAATAYQGALNAIHRAGLDANVSLKPSQFALHLDPKVAEDAIGQLVHQAESLGNFLRIDMEDAPLTDPTLTLYRTLRSRHPGHVGTVIQSYLRRSQDDIQGLMEDGDTNLRLCKGIYIEPRELAYQDFDTVRANFLALLDELLEGGAYVGIATHDEWLYYHADQLIRRRGIPADRVEFQMLLGVDEGLQALIQARGHRLRLYVPYGKAWYAYSMRRLRENPKIAMYIIQGFFDRLFRRG